GFLIGPRGRLREGLPWGPHCVSSCPAVRPKTWPRFLVGSGPGNRDRRIVPMTLRDLKPVAVVISILCLVALALPVFAADDIEGNVKSVGAAPDFKMVV